MSLMPARAVMPGQSVIPGRWEDENVMNGCVKWNSVYNRKDFLLQRVSNPGPLDQQASG